MPSNEPRVTKAQRRDDARSKAVQMRQEQQRRERRNRLLAIGGLGLAVVVLIGVVVTVLINNKSTKDAYGKVAYGGTASNVTAPTLDSVTKPKAADANGGIPVSKAGVGVAGSGDTTLTIYFDLQCPACDQFDSVNSADLDTLSKEDGVTVVFQPLNFLDRSSLGTYYSTRAANALMIVADQDPTHFMPLITAFYKNQPAENTSGLTDAKIADIAKRVGVPDSVTAHFTDTVSGTYKSGSATKNGTWRTFAPFLAAATQHADDTLGGISTPTVLIDGKQVGKQGDQDAGFYFTPGQLLARVNAAKAAKG
ncbi:MAG: disulfide bond formation protein DsbA [Cellulomonas sp. 14-74-6]|nr:MAG: disulfide bond formation protein DsbA [Cellulomonas sp. 14-74-6]